MPPNEQLQQLTAEALTTRRLSRAIESRCITETPVIGVDLVTTHGRQSLEIPLESEDPNKRRRHKASSPLPVSQTVTQTGDIWECRRADGSCHVIMCGDSTVSRNTASLFEAGGKARMVFTSPPYNVAMRYDVYDDSTKDWATYRNLISSTVAAWLPHLREGGAWGWQVGVGPKTFHHHQIVSLQELGLKHHRDWIWHKVQCSLPLYHMTKATSKHPPANYLYEVVAMLSNGDMDLAHLHELLTNDLFQLDMNNPIKADHPARFPVRLPEIFVSSFSDAGDVVAEPFLGVGSTLIACERIGRLCYGMEISPHYVDCAVQAWQEFTGLDAVLRGSGKTFDRICDERVEVEVGDL
jgi:hypothetical protein